MEATATLSRIQQSTATASTFSGSDYEFSYAEATWTTSACGISDDTDYDGSCTDRTTTMASKSCSSQGEVSIIFYMGTSTEAGKVTFGAIQRQIWDNSQLIIIGDTTAIFYTADGFNISTGNGFEFHSTNTTGRKRTTTSGRSSTSSSRTSTSTFWL